MPRIGIVRGIVHISKRFASKRHKSKPNSCELVRAFEKCVAMTNCPFPAVICRGQGVHLQDYEGKEYLDFVGGNGAVNLGHCHPKLNKILCDQAKTLTHASRDVYTKALTNYAEYITELFCYDKVLPMNSGNEAAETAIKLARKWGYKCKRICANQAKVIVAENNSWGRSIAAVSASTNPTVYSGYGPFLAGFDTVPFSDIEALEFKIMDPNVCAFMIEPIQGDAGVIIPDPCYLKCARDLCTQNRVLMIADETLTGLGRCGCLLCCDIYRVRPDIVILGKSLGGGVLPVSAILSDSDIMDVMEPGTHGSTFGGNALSCQVAMAYLKIIQEEKLIENARNMGEILRGCLCDLPRDIVCEVRGVGLLNAIELKHGVNVRDICVDMLQHGLLAKTAPEGQIISLTPPLTITHKCIMKAAHIIRHCIENSRGACECGSTASEQTTRTVDSLSRHLDSLIKARSSRKL